MSAPCFPASPARPIHDAWFHRIKAATRDLVKACGGVVRAGEVAHASKSEVSRWQSGTDPDVIPLTAVLALEADCSMALITSVMADLNGQRLVGDGPASAVEVAGHHAEALRSMADLISSGAAALADGRITPAEATVLDRAAGDAERALAPLRRVLASVQGGVTLAAAQPGRLYTLSPDQTYPR